eukprot:6054495-Prymnesium_polylepis.1
MGHMGLRAGQVGLLSASHHAQSRGRACIWARAKPVGSVSKGSHRVRSHRRGARARGSRRGARPSRS